MTLSALKPTLARITVAAAQLHQTGHSCIAQHFSCAKVGSADFPDFRCDCAV